MVYSGFLPLLLAAASSVISQVADSTVSRRRLYYSYHDEYTYEAAHVLESYVDFLNFTQLAFLDELNEAYTTAGVNIEEAAAACKASVPEEYLTELETEITKSLAHFQRIDQQLYLIDRACERLRVNTLTCSEAKADLYAELETITEEEDLEALLDLFEDVVEKSLLYLIDCVAEKSTQVADGRLFYSYYDEYTYEVAHVMESYVDFLNFTQLAFLDELREAYSTAGVNIDEAAVTCQASVPDEYLTELETAITKALIDVQTIDQQLYETDTSCTENCAEFKEALYAALESITEEADLEALLDLFEELVEKSLLYLNDCVSAAVNA